MIKKVIHFSFLRKKRTNMLLSWFRFNWLAKSKLFFVVLAFIFASSLNSVRLFAQPLVDTDNYIRLITIDNIFQLVSMIGAKDIKVELKVKSLHRIIDLIKKNPSKKDSLSKKIVPKIRSLIKNHSQDTRKNFNYQIRQAACSTLGIFNSKDSAPKAISEIRHLLTKDKNQKVRTSCARVLGDFKAVPDLATRVLLESLNSILKADKLSKKITHEISVNLIIILRSIGNLGSKSAFIPLMRVLQSGYPVVVKKEAEEAMERIQW